MATLDDLRAGLSIDAALEIFRANCNRPNKTLWITENWIEPRFTKLRAAITGPLTEEQAAKLRDAVLQRSHIDHVIAWICDHRRISYAEYSDRLKRQSQARDLEFARREFAYWHLAEHGQLPDDATMPRNPIIRSTITVPKEPREWYLDRAKACPMCGTRADRLTWQHLDVFSGTKRGGLRWEGWMTVCEHCRIRVDSFAQYFEIN